MTQSHENAAQPAGRPAPHTNPATGSITLRGVTRAFGKQRALDGASAELPGGRVYGLIGRNGAGKTTLLRALAGQIHAEGEVLIDGQPVQDNLANLDRLVLSGADVPWPTGVRLRDVLRIGAARWDTWDAEYASRLVEEYELDEKKRLMAMSRGQRSLASIVFGLAAQCPVTLLDEPYLGLDVQNRALFYRHLLEDVERNPRTVLLSTHHIEDAERILDSVVLIDRGRITGVGDLEDLTSRVALVSGSSAAVGSVLEELSELLPAGTSSAVLSDANSSGVRRLVVDLCALAGGGVSPHRGEALLRAASERCGVRVRTADLEEAVMALTGRELE